MAIDQRPSAIDRILLVGFMGAGKTTVGRMLAQRLGWSFVDLDDRIREREGREIGEIFRDSGEEYFRKVEGECLRALLEGKETQGPSTRTRQSAAQNRRGRLMGACALGMTADKGVVVALGGGAFVRAENAALLRQTGAPAIFLDASVEELRRRCAGQAVERPLFRGENQFRQLYEARRSGYMAADLRVETGGKTPEQVVEELLAVRF
ncbi:MAG: shikimate kinase [Acidobacteriia bacterium]|nr:shikimate kinase [Terriglobia bacterium]